MTFIRNVLLSNLIFDRFHLNGNSWIKSKLNMNSITFECPYCSGALKEEFVKKPKFDPEQLKIALEAWIEMGGTENAFLKQVEEYSGIKCDCHGLIVSLEWWGGRGLFGNLSLKLGKLSSLKYLYGFYSVLLNLIRDLLCNQLSGSLDILDSFENLGNLLDM